jgi:tetratricopeptide (TPR) repeat protein
LRAGAPRLLNVRYGWKADIDWKARSRSALAVTRAPDPAPPFARRRLRWAWLLFKADLAEIRGDYDQAIALLDQANGLKPLRDERRAHRALLLLRSQRLVEAQSALASLRKEFEQSADPDRAYLRRWCTATLGLMRVESAQFDREAHKAAAIPCRPRLRRRFPLPPPPDEH